MASGAGVVGVRVQRLGELILRNYGGTIIHSHGAKTFQWGCFGVTHAPIGNPIPSTHWFPRVMTLVCQWDLIEEEIDSVYVSPKKGISERPLMAHCVLMATPL